MISIKNKIVIVTGANGGIGSVITKYLLSKGVKVIGVDVKFDNLNVFDIVSDLTTKTGREYVMNIINGYEFKIDGLVNCIGVTRENWDRTIDINLSSIYKFTRLVLKNMMDNKKAGSIINITSINSMIAFPDNPQYVASKGGLRMLSKALALDYGKYGIRVNNICPGYIHTPMTDKSFNNTARHKKILKRIILDRWGEPEDIIGAVEYLISDSSSYVTGIDLVIDGGWTTKGL